LYLQHELRSHGPSGDDLELNCRGECSLCFSHPPSQSLQLSKSSFRVYPPLAEMRRTEQRRTPLEPQRTTWRIRGLADKSARSSHPS